MPLQVEVAINHHHHHLVKSIGYLLFKLHFLLLRSQLSCPFAICSVDQFFDCLDEMRSSQFAGSSVMWSWTCSVFSAITAASNLASGSLNVTTGLFVFSACL